MARTKKTPRTFEEIARSEKMRQALGEHAIVVFHSPEQETVSPGVSNVWKQPVVDLLVEAGSHFTTNDVNLVCARFIGWCFTRPGLDTFLLRVYSVPTPPEAKAGRADRRNARRVLSPVRRNLVA
jgi:hypothetical protein